jgi:hypothetical protein
MRKSMGKVGKILGIITILALLVSSVPFLANPWPAAAQDGEMFQLASINPKALEPAGTGEHRAR